jgi:cation diffusion facilitator family transporter
VWAGFRVAARPPDADHPYGHGKAEPLTALVVAVFVFAMAGWIGFHAVHEIVTPHQGPAWWTLILLAGVIVTKVWFSRRIGAAGEQVGSTGLGVEALHHWSDAVTSGAAFVGIDGGLAGREGLGDGGRLGGALRLRRDRLQRGCHVRQGARRRDGYRGSGRL